MIYYLVTEDHSYTINYYLTSWGKEIAPKLRTIYYEELPNWKHLPLGTYIFSDIERLTTRQTEIVSNVWHTLSEKLSTHQLLNHPTRSMRRYELLRTLYEQEQNVFNVYRLTERRQPQQFPVFIRVENDHRGALTNLLHTPTELEAAIAQIEASGSNRSDKLIVEFCDTSDDQGTFRKYSAFIIGDRIIPRHLFFSRKWVLKLPDRVEETDLQEEYEYISKNPHESELRHIARLANIQYGRIDYSFHHGKIQVWEINTNPTSVGDIPLNSQTQVPRIPHTKLFVKHFNEVFETIASTEKSTTKDLVAVNQPFSTHKVAWKQLERSLRTLTFLSPWHQHWVEGKLRETKSNLRKFMKNRLQKWAS